MVAATEPLFHAVFDQAAVGLGIVSSEGVILRVNAHLASLLDYRTDELARRTFRDITCDADVERSMAALKGLFVGEMENYALEKRYRRRDGSLF